ncbi:CHAT domain-containing protein [Micromonospora sp. Llam0]|uniref:CHAT domain-containing protein n=1 Tax=Micromonospora sp. Llam0 TaxID=2485143 RepID=UPI000F4754E2|nr:CHAT domain-containing protein [Micromonospora sp. Llam0]ROO61640.1 CHAT domain-containing protein [Micromonospora sp. Llam0]
MAAGDLADAETLLLDAVADWEAVRRDVVDDQQHVDLLESQAQAYRALQTCRLAAGDVAGGLEAVERARGRSLLRRLRSRRPVGGGPASSELPAPEKLPALADPLDGVRMPAALTAAAMVELAALRSTGFLVYSLVGPVADPGEAGVVAGLHIWYVDATGIEHARVGADELKSFRATDPQADAYLGLTRELLVPDFADHYAVADVDACSQLLIGAVAGALRRSRAELLVVVPDGELDRVPFAALRSGPGESLIDRWPVTVMPSVALVAELAGRAVTPAALARRILAVGNPSPPDTPIAPGLPVPRLPSLTHAEREARRVAADYGATALIGAAATRAAVLSTLPGCEVVHFATHGMYGADTGVTPGALCLSPSGDDDGYLRADDITGLDLTSCQVVLLSACRTGWAASTASVTAVDRRGRGRTG